jgi:hypothetical protein
LGRRKSRSFRRRSERTPVGFAFHRSQTTRASIKANLPGVLLATAGGGPVGRPGGGAGILRNSGPGTTVARRSGRSGKESAHLTCPCLYSQDAPLCRADTVAMRVPSPEQMDRFCTTERYRRCEFFRAFVGTLIVRRRPADDRGRDGNDPGEPTGKGT